LRRGSNKSDRRFARKGENPKVKKPHKKKKKKKKKIKHGGPSLWEERPNRKGTKGGTTTRGGRP